MTSEDDEVVGNAAAAAYVGLGVSTWRSYVARGQAPGPDRPPRIERGHALPVYARATLDAWRSTRPGQGARTDLRESTPE